MVETYCGLKSHDYVVYRRQSPLARPSLRSCSTAPRPGRLGYSNTNSLQQRLACAIPPGRQPARPTLSVTNETRRQRARRDLPYTIRDARRDSLLATTVRDHPTSTLSILPAAVARMAACRLKSSFPVWFKRAQSITEIFTSERSCAADTQRRLRPTSVYTMSLTRGA